MQRNGIAWRLAAGLIILAGTPAPALAVPYGASEARHATRTVDGDVGLLGPLAIAFVIGLAVLAAVAFVASRTGSRRPDWADEPVRGGRAAQIQAERDAEA